MLIPSHTLFGVVALASGAAVLLRRKGDRLHRVTGWTYAVSMLLLCVGSFWIQDSTPFYQGLGTFHVAALVSLVTLIGGLWSVRRASGGVKSRGAGHIAFMVWSYAGLVMATGSHAIRPLGLGLRDGLGVSASVAFALAMGICWGIPPLVTTLALRRRGEALEARFALVTARRRNEAPEA